MLTAVLPSIPRLLTALCEWFACVIYIVPLKKRFQGWLFWVVLIAFLPLQSALQYIASFYQTALQFVAGMAANVLLMMGCFFICCNINLLGAVFWGMIAFSMAEFLASLDWQIVAGTCGITSLLNCWAVFWTLFLLTVAFLVVYWQSPKPGSTERRYGWKITIEAFLLSLIQVLFSNCGISQIPWATDENYWFSFGVVRTLIDFGGVASLMLFLKIMQDQYRQKQMDSINRVLDLQYKQYLDFREASEYISRQCHDLKHQVAALRNAYTEEEKEAYLSELEQSISQYNAYCNTGNPVLDCILTQKKIFCGQHGIQFTYQADGKLLKQLPAQDICIIFGNLLDNAIEHVSPLTDPEKRQVSLGVFAKNNLLMIQVENYCEALPSLEDGLPETTKKDRRNTVLG